jgi:hypothetical protein
MNINKYDAIEFEKRGVLHLTNVKIIDMKIVLEHTSDLRKPTKLDFLKAYLTLAIPAAMLARITRKITGRKGTPLEGFLMEHYYNMSVKLLAKD